jgi:hypothetical protein
VLHFRSFVALVLAESTSDGLPIDSVDDATNMAFTCAYYHWFHLIQPWSNTNAAFARPWPSTVPAKTTVPAPTSTWSTTARAAPIDHKITCDLLVLWGERGVVNKLFPHPGH